MLYTILKVFQSSIKKYLRVMSKNLLEIGQNQENQFYTILRKLSGTSLTRCQYVNACNGYEYNQIAFKFQEQV